NRQPGVSVAIIAIDDFEVALPTRELAQVPGDHLRGVVARRPCFRDEDVLERGSKSRSIFKCPGRVVLAAARRAAVRKQAQANNVFLLRRFVRITVMTGEEETELRGNGERLRAQDAGKRFAPRRQAAQKP